ncbi:uncharacterized protein LOC116343190 isoform X2 [Contarinia nasturtii]|uniref:uncharacterized protein LOC116343190 isoform X2 n=1 Tax=Contarinia nasturtii TaxID=265458 RepID=UPI0012D49E1C|nr:uncharacterized protein LOC116343190 isoform X2 [Contarinia nasturtii]
MKTSIDLFFLVAALTSGIHLVFGNDDARFGEKYLDDMRAIEGRMNGFKQYLANSALETNNDTFLVNMLDDIDLFFKPTFDELILLHSEYEECCRPFDRIYKKYLNIMNRQTPEAKRKFKKTVNQWEGLIVTKLFIGIYIKQVLDKINELAQENSIFYQIVNEVKQGTIDRKSRGEEWYNIISECNRLTFGLLDHLQERHSFDVNGFKAQLKRDVPN